MSLEGKKREWGRRGLLEKVGGVFGGWPFFPKLRELFQISPLDILLDSEKLLGQKLALKVTQAAWTLLGAAAVQRRCWGKMLFFGGFCFVFCFFGFLLPHFLIRKKNNEAVVRSVEGVIKQHTDAILL